MNKKIIYIYLALIISFIGIHNVYASSNYRISLSANTIERGNSINLYIKGNEITGGFTISSSNTGVASVSTNTAWVENNTVTIKISALKSGSATITVTPTTVSDDNGNDLTLSSKNLTLIVTEPSITNQKEIVKKNSDANLKSLEIEGIKFNQEFKKEITEYTATAEAGTEKIKITAITNDKKANVSGIGEITVTPGKNKLEVIVASEAGTTKTYTITLEVKDYDPIIVKINNKNYTIIRKKDDLPEIELFEDKKIKIDENEIDGFYNDKLKIYLVGLKDDQGNTKLYIYEPEDKTYKEYKYINVGGITLYIKEPTIKLANFKKYKETIKNTKVNIYKINKNDKIGLIYGVNVATSNEDYYIYDKEEETLARYYNKEINIYEKINNDYKKYIISLIGTILISIIILLIISLTKSKKSKKKVNIN